MLFTGGATTKPKRDDKKEKKTDRDDRYEIQENVYIRWGNSLLANEPTQGFSRPMRSKISELDCFDIHRHIYSTFSPVLYSHVSNSGNFWRIFSSLPQYK
ncbi:hypothetical protein KIN20_026826 [Parelaphostrongylus tenuis]|uniref:Uncharacterized protein n=1 Tax=Parelaphostrongylus tenuis TaxID=148309 RepID=A0AAD5QYI7_PARTN|nr:hypothetical protein KIN20_026826 [Parelaphostrongylus tenuis]